MGEEFKRNDEVKLYKSKFDDYIKEANDMIVKYYKLDELDSLVNIYKDDPELSEIDEEESDEDKK